MLVLLMPLDFWTWDGWTAVAAMAAVFAAIGTVGALLFALVKIRGDRSEQLKALEIQTTAAKTQVARMRADLAYKKFVVRTVTTVAVLGAAWALREELLTLLEAPQGRRRRRVRALHRSRRRSASR